MSVHYLWIKNKLLMMRGCRGWRNGWCGAVDEGKDDGVPGMKEGAAVAGGILVDLTLGSIYSFRIFLSICTNCFSRNPLPKYIIWVILSGNMKTYMASCMRDKMDRLKGFPNFIWVICICTTAQVGLIWLMTFMNLVYEELYLRTVLT